MVSHQPIQTALCSFGMSGRVFHAPFIDQHPAFHFYGVWERSKQLAAQIYPKVKTFASLESLLEDENVELLVVNTPNTTHYAYAKLALEAGKHVLVEKPFTVTVKEADELIALAKAKQKLLAVYHNRRFDSDFRTIQKVIQEKRLGNTVEVEMHFDRFKEDISPKVHKEIPVPGTGCLYDLGSHLIDQALVLFGKPIAVFGDIAIMRSVSQVDDYFELLFYYNTFRVRVKASYMVREALPGYILHGSKGSFIKPKTDIQEQMLLAGAIPGGDNWGLEPETEKGLLHTEHNGKVIREYIPSEKGNYMDFYEGLYQGIRWGKPLPVDAIDARNVIEIIEAAFESSNTKKVVTI